MPERNNGIEVDNQLLKAVQRMDEDALTKVFDLFSTGLYNYALRRCSDPVVADQIVGDTFVKLLEQLASGKGPQTNLRSYLIEITYHLFIDHVRDNKLSAPLEVGCNSSDNAQPHSILTQIEEKVSYEELCEVIRSNSLSVDQKQVIILRFLEDFSLEETAKITGICKNTVKQLQKRGMDKLIQVQNPEAYWREQRMLLYGDVSTFTLNMVGSRRRAREVVDNCFSCWDDRILVGGFSTPTRLDLIADSYLAIRGHTKADSFAYLPSADQINELLGLRQFRGIPLRPATVNKVIDGFASVNWPDPQAELMMFYFNKVSNSEASGIMGIDPKYLVAFQRNCINDIKSWAA